MSCPGGECREPGKRLRALIMLGLMMLVFIVLSGFSFLGSRNQVTPDEISFGSHFATEGKRVFQAYNCMDCHTIVGNGAYLGPDLTKKYAALGPAWLAAFLPSANMWPTEFAVQTQLKDKDIAADAGVDTLEAYYEKYPEAKERVQRRGGKHSYMPTLRFRAGEVSQLIAFFKYTSAMNTEGWPPKVMTGSLEHRLELLHGRVGVSVAAAAASGQSAATTPSSTGSGSGAAVERGAQLAQTLGCAACHSTDGKKITGPSWKGIYGTQEKLTDGTSATVNDAYITESILKPNAKVVEGYPEGTMPPYEGLVTDEQIKDIIAYIKTL